MELHYHVVDIFTTAPLEGICARSLSGCFGNRFRNDATHRAPS